MRNRAKCRKCESIIESFHRHDYVTCKCGEISVDGGNDYHKCSAIDWKNFLRVDDLGNEIIVTVKEKEEVKETIKDPLAVPPPTRKDLLDMLDMMIKNIENLPQDVMMQPVNHYDLVSSLVLISSLFRAAS